MKRLFILIFVIILCSCNSKDTDKSTNGGYDVDFNSIFIKKSDIKFSSMKSILLHQLIK